MSRTLYASVLSWFLLSLFYAYQYIYRVLPGMIVPELMYSFDITSDDIGTLGIYYIGYGLFHIPIGLLMDRYPVRIVVPACLLLCIAGNFPLIYSQSWTAVYIGRLVVGMGSSGAIIGIFKILAVGFSEKTFSKLLGVSVSLGLAGAVFGTEPLSKMFEIYGWKNVLQVIMFLGLILAVAIILFVKQKPSLYEEHRTIKEDLITVFKCRKLLLLGLFGGLMVGPLEGFADAWGREFFKIVYSLDSDLSARFPSLIFLGMCIGCSTIGYVGQKTNAYYGILIFSALIMAGLFVWTLSGTCPYSLMYMIFSVVGVLCAYQIIVIYKATTYLPPSLTGISSAIANCIMMGCGFLFHKVIGKIMLLNAYVENDIIKYPPEAFIKALASIPLALFIAAVGLILLKIFDKKDLKAIVK